MLQRLTAASKALIGSGSGGATQRTGPRALTTPQV